MAEARSYRDLVVWQKGMDLAAEAYDLARRMPKAEEYRLVSQLIRAATSVPSNLAEGNARASRKDYAHFVSIAKGSVAEVETLLLLAVRVQLISHESAHRALDLAGELGRMLNVLHGKLARGPSIPGP